MISVKELSPEEKALLIININFEHMLQYLGYGQSSLKVSLAFKSTVSGVWMYSLKWRGLSLVSDGAIEAVDKDAFEEEYFGIISKSSDLDMLFKNRNRFESRIYSKERKRVSAFDEHNIIYAALEGPRVSPRNLEIVTELFNSYIDSMRGEIRKDRVASLDRIETSRDYYQFSREFIVGYLSKRIYGNSKDNRREDLYESLCMIASASYEKAQNKGTIWCNNKIVQNGPFIKFSKSVEIRRDNVRQIRKLLEMSGKDNTLVLEEGHIIGTYNRDGNDAGTGIEFTGNGKWNLFTSQNRALIKFDSVTFSLSDQIVYSKLNDSANVVFDGEIEYETVKSIVSTVEKQSHGTTLIISDNARSESERLARYNRAILIEPKYIIDEKTIISLTSIDGALIIDPNGCCYAIGAILDGVAETKGTNARGSRYNSAITYVDYRKKRGDRLMAVIISEDNSTDIYVGQE